MMAMAGGAHAEPDATIPTLGAIFFPFATLFERATSVAGFTLAAIFFLFQFPAYGVAIGYGNFKGKFIQFLLAVFGLHLVVYLIAT